MESWRKVFREAVVPLLDDRQLRAVRDGLLSDDVALIQGVTTTPPPLACVQEWPVEAACFLGYCGWRGSDLTTVAEVEEFFARMCYEIDQRLGEAAGCRKILNWWDETDRVTAFREMLAEVEMAISARTFDALPGVQPREADF